MEKPRLSTAQPRALRPRRRWLRFSLRTLLLVVTVFGVWLGVKVDQARRQKEAADTLRALGAEIVYEHQRVGNDYDAKLDLDVPLWARQLCGDDFFQTVTWLFILRQDSNDKLPNVPRAITDEELICLADLPYLERIDIDNQPITDAGLAHLPHPERLQVVALNNTNVGDDFVRRLKGSKRLVHISLYGTKVTDEGLAELGDVSSLEALRVGGTESGDRTLAAFADHRLNNLQLGRKTTDAGLRQFRTLSEIRFLLAEDCQITGETFRGLNFPKIDSLHLENCAVGDGDLPPIVEAIRDVRVLLLEGCPITDRGLEHLKELGKTRTLLLANTKIQGRELQRLTALSGLAVLDLSGCPLDDPDLESLKPLYTGTSPGMNLTLARTPIGDADLAKIGGFTNLTHLDLSATKLTDAALPHVYLLTKLAVLDLRGTKVTAQGVAALKQAIAGVVIAWDGDPQPANWPW